MKKIQYTLLGGEEVAGFIGDIEKLTLENKNFRRVLFTGQHTQLVLMSLNPGEEIGTEVHETTDQFFRIEQGDGKVIINGEESQIKDGDAIVVPAGTEHNVINTGQTALKLYTLYSPPHHKDGAIHKTKSEALLDTSDHL